MRKVFIYTVTSFFNGNSFPCTFNILAANKDCGAAGAINYMRIISPSVAGEHLKCAHIGTEDYTGLLDQHIDYVAN